MEQVATLRAYAVINADPHLRSALKHIAWGNPDRFAACAKAVLSVMPRGEEVNVNDVDWQEVYEKFSRSPHARPR